jgi:hypothetical protein
VTYRLDLPDSSLSQGSERTTTFVGQRRIKDSDEFFLLTSFNRTVRDGARLEVPWFAKIPLVGKASGSPPRARRTAP